MSSARVVVVTGGALGIGRATVRRFAEGGHRVIILDVDTERGAEVANEIEGTRFISCDVTAEDQVADAIALIAAENERIDVLVNNAGGFPSVMSIEEATLDDWHRTLDLNVTSVFLMIKAALPLMRKSSAGRIVNVGSLAGQTAGWPTSPAYAAAKAAVHSITRALAVELAADGITVNAVAPSAVRTERILALRDDAEMERTAASIPMGRYQEPGETAALILFLAGEDAGFMTGQTVSINGGRFMA